MKKEYLYTDRIILFNVNVFIQIIDFNQEKTSQFREIMLYLQP
jgi:hypothetical protein